MRATRVGVAAVVLGALVVYAMLAAHSSRSGGGPGGGAWRARVRTADSDGDRSEARVPADVSRVHYGAVSLVWNLAKVSDGAVVTADVAGNLGAPQVVASPQTADWLADRWQAARDMSGTPIAGPHWLEMALAEAALPTKIVLDWETARADDYVVKARNAESGEWGVVLESSPGRKTSRGWARARDAEQGAGEKHIMHVWEDQQPKASKQSNLCDALRLEIAAPATQWGVSLWQFAVWGLRLEV
ncbi:uncharacterized protein AMSG_00710 [Thecamonas trahens ATCC 50062]|uniref:F5/8 type C domain-containing protein n=1 Tax=Thecamonas trahens ATCC 50062 TaxID=461836 RepID=A0A0L0DE20_THETB|nr:hypothetical protein AMSG_00710 [Thecamonas trahens ATCC 50062]KNC50549.1 hypothetical protein AMSG_00710 [Thecamonas trahens ATCC 50062]|eukprot:XP_013762439.1 hypothetical protein AMSG_00710 [Thecamonas trahens ATCC 50062]